MSTIDSMSFVPTSSEYKQLIKHSRGVLRKDRRNLSKLHSAPFDVSAAGLLPDSLNPDDTILSKIGRSEHALRLDISVFSVINDMKMPLGGGSNGPNGVLTNCNGIYGKNRVNLFHEDHEQTKKLLDAYISCRNARFSDIFGMYVDKLNSFKGGTPIEYRIHPKKPEQIPEHLRKHYDNVCLMMTLIKKHKKEEIVMGVDSFCQTWLRKDGAGVGDAHFSVMSPHFQTRFYIKSSIALINVPGITEELIRSYIELVKYFQEEMSVPYGLKGTDGKQSFINMDDLQDSLQ